MKICIVSPSFKGGGAEKVAVNLANYYISNGHEVTFLCFNIAGPYREQLHNQIKLVEVKHRARYLPLFLPFYFKSIKPDVILSTVRDSNILVGLAAYCMKYRVFFREANTMHAIERYSPIKKLICKLLMKLAYSQALRVIANSADTKQDLIKHGIVADNKCVVIGNPVLVENFNSLANEPVQHEWLCNPDLKVILNIGRLQLQKNQAFLLQTFSQVKQRFDSARLIILGEGEERDNLLRLAKTLGVSDAVQIVNFQINPYPYYKHAEVFVLTSSWEGFGNVLVEAMACETPVISTDCPGGPKLILANGEFGDLVPMDNRDELANRIIQVLTLPPDAIKLNKARLRANEFSIEHAAEKYLQAMSF